MFIKDKRIDQLYDDNRSNSKTKTCFKNRIYCGNTDNLGIVISLWAGYLFWSSYFLAVISPYFWVEYSPAVTIVGIFVAIPGIYNAIICFFTGYSLLNMLSYNQQIIHNFIILLDPGVLKKGTYNYKQLEDIEEKKLKQDEQIKQQGEQEKELNKIEQVLETQKVVINDKRDSKVIEKDQQNIKQIDQINPSNMQQINELEPPNKEMKISPKNSIELPQIQPQAQQQNIDQWVDQIKQGLNKVQNGLVHADNQMQKVRDGLQHIQTGIVNDEEQTNINTNDQSSNPQKKLQAGNLFLDRYCETCKIKRPPLASHCKFISLNNQLFKLSLAII